MSNRTVVNLLLESIAEIPDQQVTKTGKSSFFLSSFGVSQASTITAEAIMIQMQKKSLGIALTRYCTHHLSFSKNSN